MQLPIALQSLRVALPPAFRFLLHEDQAFRRLQEPGRLLSRSLLGFLQLLLTLNRPQESLELVIFDRVFTDEQRVSSLALVSFLYRDTRLPLSTDGIHASAFAEEDLPCVGQNRSGRRKEGRRTEESNERRRQ